MGPQDRCCTVYSNPENLAKQRSDDIKDKMFIPLSQRLDVLDAFAHESTDDMETVALIGDGHAFGKKRGACHGTSIFSGRSTLEPSAKSLRNDKSPNAWNSSRKLRNDTQQVQKQMINPSCSWLRGLTR